MAPPSRKGQGGVAGGKLGVRPPEERPPPYGAPHRRPPRRYQGGSRRGSRVQGPSRQSTAHAPRWKGQRLTNKQGRGRSVSTRGTGKEGGDGCPDGGVWSSSARRPVAVRWAGGAVSAAPFKSGASAAGGPRGARDARAARAARAAWPPTPPPLCWQGRHPIHATAWGWLGGGAPARHRDFFFFFWSTVVWPPAPLPTCRDGRASCRLSKSGVRRWGRVPRSAPLGAPGGKATPRSGGRPAGGGESAPRFLWCAPYQKAALFPRAPGHMTARRMWLMKPFLRSRLCTGCNTAGGSAGCHGQTTEYFALVRLASHIVAE